jgi:hypothetical protein
MYIQINTHPCFSAQLFFPYASLPTTRISHSINFGTLTESLTAGYFRSQPMKLLSLACFCSQIARNCSSLRYFISIIFARKILCLVFSCLSTPPAYLSHFCPQPGFLFQLELLLKVVEFCSQRNRQPILEAFVVA